MLIDTHCHLEMMVQHSLISTLSPEQYQTIQSVVNEAEKNFVKNLITIGTTYERSLQGIAIAQKNPGVFSAIGIHPCDITPTWNDDIKKLKELAAQKQFHKIVGIGETGLDFYHPGFNIEQQKEVFRAQIELALEYDLALVVHSRNAIDETLKILQEYQESPLRGIIHCFSESLAIARDIQKLNFMMGIAAIITYPKNQYLRDIVREFELSNMVLETDSPFLPPQALRGKQNSPAQVRTVADYIATEILNVPFEKVADKTTNNAKQIFKI